MKKGSIAIIALVLAAIIGAVVLYSGTSSPASATGEVTLASAPSPAEKCNKCLNSKSITNCCTKGKNPPCQNQAIICLTGLPNPCSPTGITTCGDPFTCTPDVGPQAETCNNVDDNCDGTVDDGNPGGGGVCNSGQLGQCAAGTTNCNNGAIVCNADNAPVAEVCNNLDDDCDGANDNGIPPVACMTIDGCAGTITCLNGAPSPCTKTDPNCPVTATPTGTPAPTVTVTPTPCTVICGPAGSIGPGNGCSTNEVCSPDQCACTAGPTPSPSVTETPSVTGTPTDCVGATGACPGPAGQSCCEGLTCFAGQCGAP